MSQTLISYRLNIKRFYETQIISNRDTSNSHECLRTCGQLLQTCMATLRRLMDDIMFQSSWSSCEISWTITILRRWVTSSLPLYDELHLIKTQFKATEVVSEENYRYSNSLCLLNTLNVVKEKLDPYFSVLLHRSEHNPDYKRLPSRGSAFCLDLEGQQQIEMLLKFVSLNRLMEMFILI